MRVLMLTQSYAPVVGGEERVVEDLSGELIARGHRVTIATLRQHGRDPSATPKGARVEALGGLAASVSRFYSDRARRPAPPAPDPATVVHLRRLLEEERPDVVHAHNWLVYSYLPLDRPSGPALVLSLHDYGLVCPTKRFVYRDAVVCSGPAAAKCRRCARLHYGPVKGDAIALAVRRFAPSLRKHVDVFLPISDAVRTRAALRRHERQRVVPDFLTALPERPVTDPRLEDLPDVPFILFLGDATVDKGAWELAKAYQSLESPPPLVFVGRSFVRQLRTWPGVHVLGPWPHELAIEAIRRSLFVVVPSVWPEPFGLAALEAAAAGKPVIASDTGGLRDIVVRGETGLLVPPGDREALRAALGRLVDDPDLRVRLGEAAVARARRFSSDTVVPEFENAYRDAIDARRIKSRSRR